MSAIDDLSDALAQIETHTGDPEIEGFLESADKALTALQVEQARLRDILAPDYDTATTSLTELATAALHAAHGFRVQATSTGDLDDVVGDLVDVWHQQGGLGLPLLVFLGLHSQALAEPWVADGTYPAHLEVFARSQHARWVGTRGDDEWVVKFADGPGVPIRGRQSAINYAESFRAEQVVHRGGECVWEAEKL